MTMRKVILIGGPADGKKVAFNSEWVTVKVPVPIGILNPDQRPRTRSARYARVEHAGMDLLVSDVALFMGWDD